MSKLNHCLVIKIFLCYIFRLPDHVGNIATWSDTHWNWESWKINKIDTKLPLLCKPTKPGPITFLEKLSFITLTNLCKKFGSKVFVIEDHKSLQQALEVTKDMDCGDTFNPLGMFQSKIN